VPVALSRWPVTTSPSRVRPAVSVAVALVGLLLVAAACSSHPAPLGVASLGPTTTTAAPASQTGSGARNYADAVAYAACMRTHGVPNMPDPNSLGNFLFKGGPNGETVNGVKGIEFNSSQYVSANKACQHLLANGGQLTPVELQQALAQAVRYSQCMRTHGLPNFPDPKVSGGGISLSLGGTGVPGPNSPQMQAAMKACRSLQPGGG
jgi:hypothetical protein